MLREGTYTYTAACRLQMSDEDWFAATHTGCASSIVVAVRRLGSVLLGVQRGGKKRSRRNFAGEIHQDVGRWVVKEGRHGGG